MNKKFLNYSNFQKCLLNNFDLNNLDFRAKKKLLNEEIFSKQLLLGLYKENSINLRTKEELTSNFIQTTDNNSIVLKRPLYVTKRFGRLYGSSDGKEWLYIKPSNRKKIFKIDYKIETQLDENKETLDVFLTAAVNIDDELLTKKDIKIDKPIIELDPTVLLLKKGEKPKIPNLNKNIIYLPENTILTSEFNVTGNVIEGGISDSSIKLTALRDMFFYNNKKTFNVSFDRDNWKSAIHRFKVKKDFELSSAENEIKFKVNLSLNYKDKN